MTRIRTVVQAVNDVEIFIAWIVSGAVLAVVLVCTSPPDRTDSVRAGYYHGCYDALELAGHPKPQVTCERLARAAFRRIKHND